VTPETPTAESPSTDQDQLAARSVQLRKARAAILEQCGRVVIGMEAVVDLCLVGIVGSGHLLFEGVPGMAKTLLVKTLSELLGCDFARIQFTPDLLPGDITGGYIYDRNKSEFELRKGPLFTQILLADEINRSPAKTQSALLEAMQERQITIEGESFPLAQPFLVMATQNPVEQEGVYRLPEAQLDRFFMRIIVDYPAREHELAILKVHSRPLPSLSPVLSAPELAAFQNDVAKVHVDDRIYEYVVDIGAATRDHSDTLLGASPRALVALLRASQAHALLAGRHYLTHEDVQAMSAAVLNHRVILRPEVEIEGRSSSEVLRDILARIEVMA